MEINNSFPEQFKRQKNFNALIEAFYDELRLVLSVLYQLRDETWFDTSVGKQLDGIGDNVVITRNTAWQLAGLPNIEMTDDRYKLFLKWKALKNVTHCTFPEFVEACKLMYDPKYIYYTEKKEHPATMHVQIGANLTDEQLEVMRNALLFIKPAGVALNVDVFSNEFFGFKDTNENALGFGEGKMAISVIGG